MALEMACVYYDNQKCKKFEEPGYVSWCVLGPCDHQTPSNADRIRAMTDEELCDFMHTFNICDTRSNSECKFKFLADCRACVLEWLQQPAEGDA